MEKQRSVAHYKCMTGAPLNQFGSYLSVQTLAQCTKHICIMKCLNPPKERHFPKYLKISMKEFNFLPFSKISENQYESIQFPFQGFFVPVTFFV